MFHLVEFAEELTLSLLFLILFLLLDLLSLYTFDLHLLVDTMFVLGKLGVLSQFQFLLLPLVVLGKRGFSAETDLILGKTLHHDTFPEAMVGLRFEHYYL